MEAIDICIATTKDISYLIVSHPIYSVFGSLFVLASLMHLYCRLTLGVCYCDQDMTEKTVLITGASAGIGKATAHDMARRNARVLLACRNIGKAQKVADDIKSSTGNKNVIVKCLDLCSFESVRKCAKDVLQTEESLDVLINNAGIIGGPQKITEDGCEIVMQSNHLGHFLLTALLLELLKRSSPSRIINVASSAKNYGNIDIDDLSNENNTTPLAVYANSKLANVLFTTELAQRLSGKGVTVNALCPGLVKSDIFAGTKSILFTFSKALSIIVGKTNAEGAQTTIYLAVHPEVEKTTGKYFSDCKEEKLKEKDMDRTLAKRLFEISEEIVGVTFPI